MTFQHEPLLHGLDSLIASADPCQFNSTLQVGSGATMSRATFLNARGEPGYSPVGTPPRVFSEAMRDLDLVVSVAHRGGVDPEATASTVEMRAALVRETCAALSLTAVEVKGHHAIVRGELASYAVHLGSANATILPGTALLIVVVHSQHRGRLFLPFADDDPKTAEVLSKLLLLARDRQIKDPGILDQVRMAAGGRGKVPRRVMLLRALPVSRKSRTHEAVMRGTVDLATPHEGRRGR